KKIGNDALAKQFENELMSKLDEAYAAFIKLNANKRKEAETKCSNEVNNIVAWYRDQMKTALETSISSKTKLLETNEKKKSEATEQLKQNCLIKDEELVEPFVTKLEDRISKLYVDIQ